MKIYFYKGNENILEGKDEEPLVKITESFSKVLDGKNLSFLLGCGCSSYFKDKIEVGIPTMGSLAKEFLTADSFSADKEWLKTFLRLDIENEKFAKNLESFLSALHSMYYFYESTGLTIEPYAINLYEIIKKTKNFLISKCLNESNRDNENDNDLVKLYMLFYRKLLYRSSNLPKPNIFTTNYDLYSEIALDNLGIHYVNGFSGGIKKYFNPTIFNYVLAEKMDLSQTKMSPIDNFIYLYKIHGSLNWIQDDKDLKLFKVREIQETTFEKLSKEEVVMIHPTPLKYNASLGSPYSDLFREFQKKLMQNNNVLISIGYSFSDEHINNLIYQAFTIPSFRLIVMGDPENNNEIEKLKSLNDPRIWIIGGTLDDSINLHYFNGFVEKILPDLSNDDLDKKLETTFLELIRKHE
jgi:hypothetical protein